jgi:hypothetical protein
MKRAMIMFLMAVCFLTLLSPMARSQETETMGNLLVNPTKFVQRPPIGPSEIDGFEMPAWGQYAARVGCLIEIDMRCSRSTPQSVIESIRYESSKPSVIGLSDLGVRRIIDDNDMITFAMYFKAKKLGQCTITIYANGQSQKYWYYTSNS